MTPFEQFDATCAQQGLAEALAGLAAHLLDASRFHELFEVRKLQLRLRLGLPLAAWQPIDELPEDQGQALESGLLGICEEVGTHLFRQGDVGAAWSYLEPTGNKQRIRDLLAEVEITADNVEAIVHICLDQGYDVARGVATILDRFGTCSAITAIETQAAGLRLEQRREAAETLVPHVYQELTGNLRDALGKPAESTMVPVAGTLVRWLEELEQVAGHHIDASHLAATVRQARIVQCPDLLRLAVELCDYGQRLPSEFQYRGVPPFDDTYVTVGGFLRALLGEATERELDRLDGIAGEQRKESGVLDAAAWLIRLASNTGHGDRALDAWLEYFHQVGSDFHLNDDVAPSLQQLLARHGLHDRVAPVLKQRGDLLGYATVVASTRA